MAIKQKQSVTYVTDRGIEIEVGEMKASHLVNAIKHHDAQIQALINAKAMLASIDHDDDDPGFPLLDKRIRLLRNTIYVLGQELAARDPDHDDVGNDRVQKGNWDHE